MPTVPIVALHALPSGIRPLGTPEVALHIPSQLREMRMKDWVEGGWKFTDKNWPFGRGEHRHEGATYVLGPVGDLLRDTTDSPEPEVRDALQKFVYYTAATYTRSQKLSPKTYNQIGYVQGRLEGYRRGKAALEKFPLSCVLQVEINSKLHQESPGLLSVKLLGYGNRPRGELQQLSSFHLHVTHPELNHNPSAVRRLPYGRLLDKYWIDISITRQWLTYCDQNHGKQCSEQDWSIAMQRPGFLRVTDVDNLCLVVAPEPGNCRFEALPYVWDQVGTVKLLESNQHAMMQKDGLREFLDLLPRTGFDAMEMVSALGEKYLWVDSLVRSPSSVGFYLWM